MNDPLVRGDIYLRPVMRNDLPTLQRWRNAWDVRQVTREYRLLTEVDQERWFDSLAKKPPEHLMFVIVRRPLPRRDNPRGEALLAVPEPIGVCGLTYIDWKNRKAEASIYVVTEESGKGYGSSALKCLQDYGFGELGLHKIWAEIYNYNARSIHLFEACSFTRVATIPSQVFRDGVWHVSHIYEDYEDDWRDRRKANAQ